MKLTNQEIINAYNALDALSDKELPILSTYKIVNILDKLLNEYRIFEKAREKAKNNNEIIELLNIERELDIELLDKQELIDSGIKISPIQLVGLKRIINGWFKRNT